MTLKPRAALDPSSAEAATDQAPICWGATIRSASLVAGGLSARTIQSDGHWFVRKKDKLEASPERTAELEAFAAELVNALLPVV